MTYTYENGTHEPQTAYSFMISYPPKKEPVLKPCPFCGGKVEIVRPYYGATGAYIFCTNCRLSINLGFCRDDEALEELTDLWNRRVSE